MTEGDTLLLNIVTVLEEEQKTRRWPLAKKFSFATPVPTQKVSCDYGLPTEGRPCRKQLVPSW